MKIAVIGLGYVGLPLALAFARKFPGTVGFDINQKRVQSLRAGIDRSSEVPKSVLQETSLNITDDPEEMRGCNFFVIGVPTPVDKNNHPDLSPLRSASETVGKVLMRGSIVVYESTVYPGVTEEFCGGILEAVSGLKCGVDFKLGYSPERINPGDRTHALEEVLKVVSGQDEATLDTIAKVYEAIIRPGVFRASSIQVAEAAKVIENTQRDLNIALMNELSMIFDRMGISTQDVLEAAGTKWNFLRFVPGLVGGHCIGVDPYYLTTAAQRKGYHPEVILAGRRINDGMGKYVAQRTIKLMVQLGMPIREARVGVYGLTFKENVSDIRNSRVPDIIHELQEFGCQPVVHDPLADADEAQHEYGIELSKASDLRELDALIVAVSHAEILGEPGLKRVLAMLKGRALLFDVKALFGRVELPVGVTYWSL